MRQNIFMEDLQMSRYEDGLKIIEGSCGNARIMSSLLQLSQWNLTQTENPVLMFVTWWTLIMKTACFM